MKFNKILLFFVFMLIFTSCSKDEVKRSVLKEKSLNLQVLQAYQEGKDSLEAGDPLFAATKFNEAELLFPQSEWAPKSALMAAYSYYLYDYLKDGIAELDRFLKVYPKYKNLDYVYYLLGVSYYELIVDEKKDSQSILEAKKYFEIVINNYPNTSYALDAKFKIDLIIDQLAAKEMSIVRFYMKTEKWIPALNRLKLIVEKYDTTIFVEEALHRLVEVYYRLGLIDEARQAASILGYNYRTGEWYKKSYKVFDKNYKSKKIVKKKKDGLIRRKIKSIFE